MDYSKLIELGAVLKRAEQSMNGNKEFLVQALAAKAYEVAQAFPTDATCVSVSNFLTKRASTQMTITRVELKDVYDRFYSSNNKFAKHFAEELGLEADKYEQKMTRDEKEGHDLFSSALSADALLLNHMSAALDKSVPFMAYSEELAKKAKKVCAYELNCTGIFPDRIDVVGGTETHIMCRASYKTPVGENSVYIPVETRDGNAAIPNVFLSKEGFIKINTENLKDYIVSTAKSPMQVDVNKVLKVITSSNGEALNGLDDVARIIVKSASANVADDFINKINAVADGLDATYEQTDEMQEFSKRVTSSAGAAEFVLGKELVSKSREIVVNLMKSAGYKPQVSVFDFDNGMISYAVSVDGAGGFKVPVHIENGKLEFPKILIATDGVHALTTEGISEALSATSDMRVVASMSQASGMAPYDLIEIVRNAMAEKDFVAAEEALNVLRQSGDMTAFKTAMAAYTDGLKPTSLKKEACEKCGCSMPIKSKYSKYVMCGHTNLPMHKVYQDESGACRPLYNKVMSETEQGSDCRFLSNRVLLGE